jgi:hypothetical protein
MSLTQPGRVNSSYGNSVSEVFGGTRTILLSKASEAPGSYVSVASGALIWNETSTGDYGTGFDGSGSTGQDLPAYNAFHITVDSAPWNAGQLEIDLDYYGAANGQAITIWARSPWFGATRFARRSRGNPRAPTKPELQTSAATCGRPP